MNLLAILNDYYNRKLLIKSDHPNLPLTIWNYSQQAQYLGAWDDITLMCRGLVTDADGNIVARPFKKFFNIEEGKHTATDAFEVFEKLDGSLGIFFYYKGDPVFASRGSFISDQAVRGRQLLDKYNWRYGTYEGYTYLFEIVYPENKIVVDYGDTAELFVLGVIHTDTGAECKYSEMASEGFKLAKRYDGINDYTILKDRISDNEEGFVVRFSNGDRVKIKGSHYMSLHKLVTNISTRTVWEALANGVNIGTLMDGVPDEFYQKIRDYELSLKLQHDSFKAALYDTFTSINAVANSRTEFAKFVANNDYKHVLFAMLDGKDSLVEKYIYDLIKPEFRKL